MRELDLQFAQVRNQLRHVQIKNDSLKRLRDSLNKLKDGQGFSQGEARRRIEQKLIDDYKEVREKARKGSER